jgi:hypothetical protein
MDTNLVFVKTPIGDEAIRQSTRVVKRNLRMVLVQVDGKLTVAELSAKVGNRQLVEMALRELQAGGFIAPTLEGVSVWEEGARLAQSNSAPQFSDFPAPGVPEKAPPNSGYSMAMASSFSTFGKSASAINRPLPQPESLREAPFIAETREISPPRQAFSRGTFSLLAVIVFSSISLLMLFFFPYSNWRPSIEMASSEYLGMPVRVGAINLKLWPKPALVLSDIRLGDRGESSIESLSLPALSLVGGGVPEFERIEISGAVFSVDRLLDLAFFSTEPQSRPTFHLHRLDIERLVVKAGDLALDLSGSIVLSKQARVEKAEFENADRSIRLAAVPTSSGLALSVEGYAWKPLPHLALTFNSLQAKGVLQRGKLVIKSFDTALLGGVVKGSWMVDWSAGLSMAGDASLAHLNSSMVGATFVPKLRIEGDLSGELRLRGSGPDSAAMLGNIDAEVDVEMINGVMHGVDLGEAVRRGVGSAVRGGSTKFDRLTGIVSIKPGNVDVRAIQLTAGMLAANGRLSANSEQNIVGSLTVSLQTSVAPQRLPVKLNGALPNLFTSVGAR